VLKHEKSLGVLMPHEFVRKDLDSQGIADLLSRVRVGHLGTVDSAGKPYIVPISFNYVDGTIYFHGGKGQKMENIRGNPNICFEVITLEPPKYLYRSSGPNLRQSWECVIVRGEAEIVSDEAERVKIYGERGKKMLVCKVNPETISGRTSLRKK
jgi:nitroimidazol reductase NimA-like FMN-containing flavoprotein (pyridoxamine 5'-phosphate oxidase superfamily)